jgi:hypothetical protein
MRIRKGLGLGAALVLAWGATQAKAIDEDGKPGTRPVVRPLDRPGLIDKAAKLFDFGTPAPEKKPANKAPDKKDAPKSTDGAGADAVKPAVAAPTTEQARQEAALLRRLEVCDKLREIALETNNKELDQLAQELDDRARAVYAQRTARLKTNTNASQLEEQILDKKLGIEPMNPETMPSAKTNAGRTGNADKYQAATKGEDR